NMKDFVLTYPESFSIKNAGTCELSINGQDVKGKFKSTRSPGTPTYDNVTYVNNVVDLKSAQIRETVVNLLIFTPTNVSSFIASDDDEKIIENCITTNIISLVCPSFTNLSVVTADSTLYASIRDAAANYL